VNNAVINLGGPDISDGIVEVASGSSPAVTLTLGRQTVVNTTHGTGVIGLYAGSTGGEIIDNGTINVSGATGTVLELDVAAFVENGAINLGAGNTLVLGGTYFGNGFSGGTCTGAQAQSIIDHVHDDGGSIAINATVTGGTLAATLDQESGDYAVLSDVAFQGSAIIGQDGYGGGLIIDSGATFAGAGGLGKASITVYGGGQLESDGAATLDNADITIGAASPESAEIGENDGTAIGILTIGANTAITQDNYYVSMVSVSTAGDGIINDATTQASVTAN
jgi:hypothetical protein